jgi:hypothetical protein
MTAPTQAIRKATYERDSYLCADCGTTTNLSWQHREASGQGGRGKKAPTLTVADGLTLCLPHNEACEAEGQDKALHLGWKIRRNRGGLLASQIPFYVRWAAEWWLPGADGGKQIIPRALALELLEVAGAFTRKGAV